MFVVVFACTLFGVTLNILNCADVGVIVIVGSEGTGAVNVTVGRLGVGVTTVTVGGGATVTTVAVGGIVVNVGVTVGTGTVGETANVGDGMGEAVGVMTIGLPNSRHPRSGAAPMKPVMAPAGINSPLTAVYCVTPLSIAGEEDCRSKPLKSSSTVSHVPSEPGLGAAEKRGSCPVIIPVPKLV